MCTVITIFTLILVLLQRGRSEQLENTECCHESVPLNISLPSCVGTGCSYPSKNITGNQGTRPPLNDKESSFLPDERPSEYTTDYSHVVLPNISVSTDPPFENEYSSNWADSGFYKHPDGYVKFDSTSGLRFKFSPYYECKEVTRTKTIGNLYIKCPCENIAECCPPGNLIFEKDEEIGSFWECSLKIEEVDVWKYLSKAPEGQEPHILLYNTFYRNNDSNSNGSMERQYNIVRSEKPYYNKSVGGLQFSNLNFVRKFNCNIEEIHGNNSIKYQGLVCEKDPFDVPFQKFYAVIKCSCIAFSSATLLVFILLPSLRTMKTTIVLSQTFCYFVRDVVDLPYCLGGWQPYYTECIAVAYNVHFWDLAASFWSNIMSIDLALTFRGRGFNRGKDRKTFLLYSLYGWGGPLIITLVTAILGFWVPLPRDFLKPDINLEYCWFHTLKAMVIYHYVPAMVLAAINVPLLGYTVYNIVKSVCSADILRNKDSGRHVGNKVKRESRTRLILYFNLALLIGSPKSLQFIKLLVENEAIVLVLNTTGLLRAICMFLFVSCKKRVFVLMKKRLLFKNLSVSSVITSLSSKSYDLSSTKMSNSVSQQSTPL